MWIVFRLKLSRGVEALDWRTYSLFPFPSIASVTSRICTLVSIWDSLETQFLIGSAQWHFWLASFEGVFIFSSNIFQARRSFQDCPLLRHDTKCVSPVRLCSENSMRGHTITRATIPSPHSLRYLRFLCLVSSKVSAKCCSLRDKQANVVEYLNKYQFPGVVRKRDIEMSDFARPPKSGRTQKWQTQISVRVESNTIYQ